METIFGPVVMIPNRAGWRVATASRDNRFDKDFYNVNFYSTMALAMDAAEKYLATFPNGEVLLLTTQQTLIRHRLQGT
jgi:hypothetical protein